MYINTNRTLSNYVFLNTTNDDEGTASVVLYNNNSNNSNNNETLTFDNIDIFSSRQQKAYDIGCNVVAMVAWMGVVLTNTILFAKTYRVYKVTLFRKNQTIKPQNVLGPYIISVILSAIVLIALTVTKPLQFSTIVNLNNNNGYCQCYGLQRLNIAMFTIDIIIGLGILVLAWKVRNTNEEISEGRKIFILIILGVVLDIAIILIFSLIWDIEDDARVDPFLIIGIILILKSLLPIWFLICPRMYYVWYEYKHGHLPESITVPGIGHVRVGGTDNMITTATNNNNNNNSDNNNDKRDVTIHNLE